MWSTYQGRVEGILLRGDSKVPPTTWWNHLYLLHFVWKEVTILKVPDEVTFYRVGYIPFRGKPKCSSTIMNAPRFAVRHGHEDCAFFTVLEDGTEIPLVISTRTTIDELPTNVPLV